MWEAVSKHEVCQVIDDLKIASAPGIDEISVTALKHAKRMDIFTISVSV
jgi:hypothetical protein